jgi:hypothetical protein
MKGILDPLSTYLLSGISNLKSSKSRPFPYVEILPLHVGTFKYSTIVKHETNVIANLNICKSWGVRGGGFLHLLIKSGRDLIPISRHKMRRGGIFTNICCPHNTLRNILSEQGKGETQTPQIQRKDWRVVWKTTLTITLKCSMTLNSNIYTSD